MMGKLRPARLMNGHRVRLTMGRVKGPRIEWVYIWGVRRML